MNYYETKEAVRAVSKCMSWDWVSRATETEGTALSFPPNTSYLRLPAPRGQRPIFPNHALPPSRGLMQCFVFKDATPLFREGREQPVTADLTTVKGTPREGFSLTESHGELGISPWLWRSKDAGPGTRQAWPRCRSRLRHLLPRTWVLSEGFPPAAAACPRELVKNAESTQPDSACYPDPRDSYTG